MQARDVSGLIAGGDTPEDHEFLNTFLLDAVAASPYRPRLHFFISRDDSHYENHLQAAAGGARRQGPPVHDRVRRVLRRTPPSASRSAATCSSGWARAPAARPAAPADAAVVDADVVHVDPGVPEPGELEGCSTAAAT